MSAFTTYPPRQKRKSLMTYPFGSSSVPLRDETTNYLTKVTVLNDSTVYFPGTAYENPGSVIWSVTNEFVDWLITKGLFAKLRYFHPCIGNSASMCKWNMISPLDTDAAHRLSFAGGITFSGGGLKFNGANAEADPHFNFSTDSDVDNVAFGHFSRTAATSKFMVDQGVQDSSGRVCYVLNQSTDGRFYAKANTTSGYGSASVADGSGLFYVGRNGNDLKSFRDEAKLFDLNVPYVAAPVGDHMIGCDYISGTGFYHSDRELNDSFLFDEDLTDLDYAVFFAGWKKFEQGLKRWV